MSSLIDDKIDNDDRKEGGVYIMKEDAEQAMKDIEADLEEALRVLKEEDGDVVDAIEYIEETLEKME